MVKGAVYLGQIVRCCLVVDAYVGAEKLYNYDTGWESEGVIWSMPSFMTLQYYASDLWILPHMLRLRVENATLWMLLRLRCRLVRQNCSHRP